jgi:hypothetical protein
MQTSQLGVNPSVVPTPELAMKPVVLQLADDIGALHC